MIVTGNITSPTALRTALYSGIALIVVSMLFLGQSFEAATFVAQAVTMLAAPAFFYGVGALVYRYLDAPLAAPSILATGAWLIAISLIHLSVKDVLLPPDVRPYYWSVASTLAAVIITLTGHNARIWLLIPLVPVMQINAMWAVMGIAGLPIAWIPSVSFILVLVWWEIRLEDEEWMLVYKTSAVLLTLALIAISYFLTASTTQSIVATWVTGAALVGLLGLRHGWVNFGPLAIVMLVCASIWGLPPEALPLAWLALATATVVFVEQQSARPSAAGHTAAIELSVALAVILSGAAALFSSLAFWWDVMLHPAYIILMLLEAGLLLGWLGLRRALGIAAHVGLWLIASAWAKLYFFVFNDPEVFGLWLSLLAAFALLVERMQSSFYKKKHKKRQSFAEAVMRWPLADLSLGLTVMIVLWMFMHIMSATPFIVAVTMAAVVGIWIVAGLFYRLPVLLHVALWMAPLPYALVVMQFFPPFRDLTMVGLAWQILAVACIVLGHSLTRHRPGVVLPFFTTGYSILGLSLLLTIQNAVLLPLSLALVWIVSLTTSVLVIADRHPVWTALVGWLIPAETRPHAFRTAHNLFLLLGAWLLLVWIHLLLGYTDFTLSRQGVTLVFLSAAWIMLGRLLPRIPGVIGWPVYGAGWAMWLLGLLSVFHAPTEALVTIIFGLAVSAEAVYRTREVYWMPVFVLQILFTALQLTWLLALPTQTVLLVVMVFVCIVSIFFERRGSPIGQAAALTSGGLALLLWAFSPDLAATLCLSFLGLCALAQYPTWGWLPPLYTLWAVQGSHVDWSLHWQGLLLAGIAHTGIGIALANHVVFRPQPSALSPKTGEGERSESQRDSKSPLRLLERGFRGEVRTGIHAHPRVHRWATHTSHLPRRHLKIQTVWFGSPGWGNTFLWLGTLMSGFAVWTAAHTLSLGEMLSLMALLVGTTAVGALASGWRNAPFIPLILGGLALFLSMFHATGDLFSMTERYTAFLRISTGTAAAALVLQLAGIYAVSRRRPFPALRRLVWWIRPVLAASHFLIINSTVFMVFISTSTTHVQDIPLILGSVLIAVFYGVRYAHQRRQHWLWLALGMGWLAWASLLQLFELSGIFWHTIPVSMVLLGLALCLPRHRLFEYTGITMMILGIAQGVSQHGLMSFATALSGFQLAGLAVYGYLAGRRVPFAGALAIVGGGVAFRMLLTNFWLLPLAAGIGLLAVALVLETHQGWADRMATNWRRRWARWR